MGNLKTIYHVGERDWFKRDSEKGDEAASIQAERAYKTWLEENTMKWNKQYEYPKSMRTSIEGKRHYEITGEKFAECNYDIKCHPKCREEGFVRYLESTGRPGPSNKDHGSSSS